MTSKSAAVGTLPLTLSESEFQSTVMDLAKLSGWRICHVRTVAVRHGGRIVHQTPYEGHSGLPDLILARDGVVILAELKSQQGRATPEQRAWLAAAGGCGRLWKPSDWVAIRAELTAAARTGGGEHVA